VKNKTEEEVPLQYIERNPLFLLGSAALSATFIFLTYYTVLSREADVINPKGFFLFIPSLVISFQTLWLLLNPFAIFYHDRLEIKYSLFRNRVLHFVDLKHVGQVKGDFLKIIYNDDEMQRVGLLGIRNSQKKMFSDELQKHVSLGLEKRPDDKASALAIVVAELRKQQS
jgi:hypothetical protein